PVLYAAAKKAQDILNEGITLYQGAADAGLDLTEIASLQLMTAKPFIYVFNTDDAGLADTASQEALRKVVAPAKAIFLDAKFESELVELEPEEAAEKIGRASCRERG